MKKYSKKAVIAIFFFGLVCTFICFSWSSSFAEDQPSPVKSGFMGSSECRPCHERFYQLWAPSHHGRAMQPYTPEFAVEKLTPQKEDITIENVRYRAVIDQDAGYVLETSDENQTKYPILHVMGGKNVYYFLTPLERGHLQVLPVAYDIHRRQWYDTAASGIRHFPGAEEDRPYHWKDRPYTFNTSCYGCHVSQLVKNYDLKTDSYHTQWREPGINCEACHGPAEEHVRVCLEAEAKGEKPKEMKLNTITQSRGYTAHQVDTACSICHAKAIPLTSEFIPGDDFYQHYDLVTLEHPDSYPDGRDLGENYTFTTWRLSPCAAASKLDCMYCHTSSGRYRFAKENPNGACASCHKDKADNLRAHTHHNPNKVVNQCIQCHMPKTEFGRMIRSDHSMRPPMPSATIKFKSPNACTMCHRDKDAAWADRHVRRWHKEDYQQETLKLAGWIDQARKGQWDQIDEILAWIQSKAQDEIFTNSLVRLLRDCPDEKKWPVIIGLLKEHPSPLVRSSAADLLELHLTPESLEALLTATKDPYLLVRIRAAASLAAVPQQYIPDAQKKDFQKAVDEYKTAMMSRPDDAMSHYNLGNFYQHQRQYQTALDSFKTSWTLQEDYVPAYVNASLAYNALGQNDKAVDCLKNALKYDPKSVAAHLNLALLYGEMERYDDAEAAFRKTFELEPTSAVAAYNLGVLLAKKNPDQTILWIRKACELEPDNSKYACTLAYYYAQQDRTEQVIETFQPFADRAVPNPQIYLMLGQAYLKIGNTQKAIETFEKAAEHPRFDEQTQAAFREYLKEAARF